MRIFCGSTLTALAVGSLMFSTSSGWAQSAKAYVGTYTLVSVKIEQGGKTIEPLGPHPIGSLMLDSHGHFSWILMRPDLPNFVSNNRLQSTPDENSAVVKGSLIYFGTYTISGKTMTLKIEGSTFPNWKGTTQERALALKGPLLTATNSASAIGGASTAMTVWKRAK